MIFFHRVHDLTPKDYGELIMYLFANEADIAMETIELSMDTEEYLSCFTSYDISKMNCVEVWQLSKLLLFGSIIVN